MIHCFAEVLSSINSTCSNLIDEDWNQSRFIPNTPLHILSPLSFHGKLAKALVPDDPRLAQ